jgi:hypothetical protein
MPPKRWSISTGKRCAGRRAAVVRGARAHGHRPQRDRRDRRPEDLPQCLRAAARLIIVGAVHIAQSLAPMATMLDSTSPWSIRAAPGRPANRFPGVKVMQDWADEAFQQMGLDVSTASSR